ncbi:MAG: hypothetical protein V4642_10710 [Bacteroidota bacterium]
MKNLSFIFLIALILCSGCGAELRDQPPIVGPVFAQQTMSAKINGENAEFVTVGAVGRKTTDYDLMIVGQKYNGPEAKGVMVAIRVLSDATEYTILDTNSALDGGFSIIDNTNTTTQYTGISGKLIFTSRTKNFASGVFDFIAVNNFQTSDTVTITEGKFKVEILQ